MPTCAVAKVDREAAALASEMGASPVVVLVDPADGDPVESAALGA